MPSIFSRSLLYPLAAACGALAVLPVALLGWGFVKSNQEQVATLEKQYLTRQAVGLAREIELFFVDSLGRIDTTARVLRPELHGGTPRSDVPGVLSDVVRSNRHLLLLRLLDDQGEGPYVQSRALDPAVDEAVAVVLRDAFAANLRQREVRQDLVPIAGHEPVAIASLPLVSSDGRVAGALQGVVSLAWVSALLAEEASRGVTVDIVAADGRILFSSDRGRVGTDAAKNPLVEQFLQAPVRLTKTYRDPLREGDAEVLGSLCPVAGVTWAVVTARDAAVAFAAVHAMARRTALLAVGTGLVAILAGVLLARRITLPVRHLADVSSAMAEGDYARRVPIHSRNELGQLAANFNRMGGEVERTVSSLRRALHENQELFVDAIRALTAAIDAKSRYTHGHSERVSLYAVAIARHLGLSEREIKTMEISALLHDIGKIGIEDAILQKPEALTEGEFNQMRGHAMKGAAIVGSIKKLREMLPGVRSHHENWGGGGYPDGLSGEGIPLIARILAAADVFDAMTTSRPYQGAVSQERALGKLRELAGNRLDPRIVEALLAAVRAGDLVAVGEEVA